MAPQTTVKRRRRRPEEAEREILEAAQAVLHDQRFHDLTVEDVMDRTTLSRPSFYVHFRDRNVLLERLTADVQGQLVELVEGWVRSADLPGEDEWRPLFQKAARIYAENWGVLAAVADAATHSAEGELAYRAAINGIADSIGDRIAAEVSAGRMEVADPARTARALFWMTERMFIESLCRDDPDDADAVAEALLGVWMRTLYQRQA